MMKTKIFNQGYYSHKVFKSGETTLRNLKKDYFLQASASLKNSKSIKNYFGLDSIQVIDFFSGAGGTSVGFAAINEIEPTFQFLAGVDIDELSAETYAHNFHTSKAAFDIREISKNKNNIEEFLNYIHYDKEKPTILIGCPPCQGFSSHRKKHWDKEDDERNDLILAFAKIVSHIQPEAVLIENVPEFLSNKYWGYFQEAVTLLRQDNYNIKQSIYSSAGFGVPQERFRSIIIGMKKEFLLPEPFYGNSEYKTVRDAISDLKPLSAGERDISDPLHKSVAHKSSTIDVIKQIPHNGGSRPAGVGPKCLDKVNGFSDVYGRLYWDRPSITITHYARNPASGRFVHPDQNRGLSAREAARLQSFPDSFAFSGKSDDIYRQIGEAVPPLLSTGVVINLLIELFSEEPTKEMLADNRGSIESPVSSSFSSVIAGIKHANKKE